MSRHSDDPLLQVEDKQQAFASCNSCQVRFYWTKVAPRVRAVLTNASTALLMHLQSLPAFKFEDAPKTVETCEGILVLLSISTKQHYIHVWHLSMLTTW